MGRCTNAYLWILWTTDLATYQRHPLQKGLKLAYFWHQTWISTVSRYSLFQQRWFFRILGFFSKTFLGKTLFQSSMNLRWRGLILFNQSGFQLDVSQGLSWMSLPFERNWTVPSLSSSRRLGTLGTAAGRFGERSSQLFGNGKIWLVTTKLLNF